MWWAARRAARLVSPSILLLSAAAKLATWSSFEPSVRKLTRALEGSPWTAEVLLYGIPAVEVAVAVSILLSSGGTFRIAAWTAFLLSIAFVAVRVRVMLSGLDLMCPCFGGLFPTDRFTVVGLVPAVTLVAANALLFWDGDPLDERAPRPLSLAFGSHLWRMRLTKWSGEWRKG